MARAVIELDALVRVISSRITRALSVTRILALQVGDHRHRGCGCPRRLRCAGRQHGGRAGQQNGSGTEYVQHRDSPFLPV